MSYTIVLVLLLTLYPYTCTGQYIGQTGRVVSLKSLDNKPTAVILTDGLNTEILCDLTHLNITSEITAGLGNLMGKSICGVFMYIIICLYYYINSCIYYELYKSILRCNIVYIQYITTLHTYTLIIAFVCVIPRYIIYFIYTLYMYIQATSCMTS